MARPIDKKDAKIVVDKHKKLFSQLRNITKKYEDFCGKILDAINKRVREQSVETLKTISVDELNRNKKGFRVKLLKDSGINTIWDLSQITVERLSGINGISIDSAREMKKGSDAICKTVTENVKIKLSADNKTTASTALINAISVYLGYEPYLKACYDIFKEHSSEISSNLDATRPLISSFKWMFASSAKKDASIKAFEKLSLMLNEDYYQKSVEYLSKLKSYKIASINGWENFTANPVAFFNVIELLHPDVLGTDDKIYGLSEELAQEVMTQKVSFEGLKCQLRKYQELGVRYSLRQKRVLLGDEMGLGKTIQAIACMVSLRNNGNSHFIVVCPASVLSNWCREIKKMSDLNVVKIHGATKLYDINVWMNEGGVAVTTYETTSIFQFHDAFRYSMLIVDEAHYIKNPKAKRTENVKSIIDNADNVLFMTGTALENKVEEMINLISMLNPEVAQSVHGLEFLSSAQEFKEKVATVYYRRKREDVLTELPDMIENKDWCELNKTEERAYEDAVLNDRFSEARRVSWNIDDISKSSKANRMLEIIEDASEDGRKVIVFSFFLDTINKIVNLLGDKCVGPINGSVPPQKRQEMVDEFNNAPAGTVLAAQIQAGGTGLNIQSASVIILCEPQFKPSIENQAISRAYRMGQTRNVLVHRLLCDETVDERVTEILESKQTIFDAFADDSVAAEENFELDDTTFSNIMKEEAKRINDKNTTEG